MAKKDIVIENLKGFIRMGASTNSPGNIPTGHFNLDFAIHYGTLPQDADLSALDGYDPSVPLGIPLGKIIEIFGEEGGGKSSLAYRIAGYAQKMGYPVAWIDTENSFSSSLALINGANQDNIYYADMSNKENEEIVYHAEDVLDAIVLLCKNGVKIIVVDSVANMVPKYKMENNAEKQTMGLMARILSDNLGKVANCTGKYGATVIFINQLREKIGVLWGDNETSPGGHALKHNASLRLKVSKKNNKDANIEIEDAERKMILVGRNSTVKIVKNRFAKPLFASIDVPIFYEPYFPDIEDLMFDFGRQLKLIFVRKGIFKWDNYEAEGKKAFVDMIKSKNLNDKLYEALETQAKEVKSFLPPEITQWYNKQTKSKKKESKKVNNEDKDSGD